MKAMVVGGESHNLSVSAAFAHSTGDAQHFIIKCKVSISIQSMTRSALCKC